MELNAAQGEDIAHEATHDVFNFDGWVLADDIHQGPYRNASIVFLHLSMTMMTDRIYKNRPSSEICQISATYDGIETDLFILPSGDISPNAKKFYSLNIRNDNNKKILVHDGFDRETMGRKDALQSLLDFILENVDPRGKVLLAAHYCFRFGAKVLIREMRNKGLWASFQRCVLGFIDTSEVFKLKSPEEDSYQLDILADMYLINEAYDDKCPEIRCPNSCVQVLEFLVKRMECTDADMKQATCVKELTMFN